MGVLQCFAMLPRVRGLVIGLLGLASLIFGATLHVAVLESAPVRPLRCAHPVQALLDNVLMLSSIRMCADPHSAA